jgi:branched-chain amino acid transport system substrate-binding protein
VERALAISYLGRSLAYSPKLERRNKEVPFHLFDERKLDSILSSLANEKGVSRRSFLQLFGGATGAAMAGPALLAACGGTSGGGSAPKSNEPFNLGVIYPVTGPLVASFAPLFVPLNIAVSEINQAGGILGRQIKTIPFDDQGAPAQEPQVAQNILDQNLTFVAGPVGSSQCLASVQVLQTRGKMIQSPLGADPPLGDPTRYPGDFMLKETTDQDVDVMVSDYFTTGAKKPALMYENTAYGQAAAPYAAKQLAAKGVTPTTTISFDPLASSFTAEIGKVKTTGADAIFLVTGNATSSLKLVTAMIQQEYTPYIEGATVFLINVGSSLAQSVKLTNDFAAKIRVPVYRNFVWSAGKPVSKRVSDYCKKVTSDPNVPAASRYSAVQGPFYDYVHVLKQAVESAKSFDYAKVKKELENIHNYDGMIGKISFKSSDHHGVQTESMTGGSPSDFTAPESLGFLPQRVG